MSNIRHPRHGSLQFWPRKKAARRYSRIRNWPVSKSAKLLGFAGYKAGMTHINFIDNSTSINKGSLISQPVTILECPPIKTYSLRFYKSSINGIKLVSELYNKNVNKQLTRKLKPSKKDNNIPSDYDIIHALVYTQPHLTGIGSKKPELFEIQLSTKDINYARSLFEKDIRLQDVFQEGQQLDVHAVTKGKGLQGAIKRFGLKLKQHKSEKKTRSAGTLGPWRPKKVAFSVPHAGQMGYHTRTEYNKWLLKIGSKPEDVNPDGGFLNYGMIKNDYILLYGSIPGPAKRLIRLTDARRQNKKIPAQPPEIKYVSQASKQGK